MNKIYQRIDWENYPSSATPLNEDNLNKMDYAIDKLDDRIVTHETTKLDTATGNSLVKDVTFDETTGIFTIEKLSGSKITINTALEKISTNFHFNPTTQKLILTLIDGTTQEIDLSALLTQYEFLESDTITFTIDASGKVKANILNGSITGEKLEPNYLADVTLQANNAKTSADNAKTSEELAYQYAEDARQSASETQKNDAANITYSNATSGLTSDNVQGAIDELAQGGISKNNILLTLAECLTSSLDTDVVGAKVMTEINNALNGKMNYAELTSENLNSTFTNHIAVGLVNSYLYITIGYSWTALQFRIKNNSQHFRVYYGDSAWSDWFNFNITIDNALSETSTNPVQNKVITEALNSHGNHIPEICTLITDWNTATTNGWFMGNNATNQPSGNAWWFGRAIAHNENYVLQEVWAFNASTNAFDIPKQIRAKMNGYWGAWSDDSPKSYVKKTSVLSTVEECEASTTETDVVGASVIKEINGTQSITINVSDAISGATGSFNAYKVGRVCTLTWTNINGLNFTSWASNYVIGRLPQGYRPVTAYSYSPLCGGNYAFIAGKIMLHTGGDITLVSPNAITDVTNGTVTYITE